jgi:hypothetical protein
MQRNCFSLALGRRVAAPVNDLSGYSDEAVHDRLMELQRQKLDDPNATPAEKERAAKILHFPWGRAQSVRRRAAMRRATRGLVTALKG